MKVPAPFGIRKAGLSWSFFCGKGEGAGKEDPCPGKQLIIQEANV